MRALVIGAGIGGLTTALKLHACGIETLVLESAREIRPLGVGINLLPHGTRELIGPGLGQMLAANAIETRALKYLTQYGQGIMEDACGRAAGFRWPQYSIHRGALQMILLQAARERLGADAIRTGHHLVAFEQDDSGVVAEFSDKASGTPRGRVRGDLLIGADGIHSTVRARLYPEEAATKRVLEYPMVDRDPLDRWSFGRVTLAGDAAHPMYPMGSNGAAQAILDAEALAAALGEGDVVPAPARYEADRLQATAAVTLSNRQFGPRVRPAAGRGADKRARGRRRRRHQPRGA